MCGICGIVNLNEKKPDQSDIAQMMSSIKHRGPNDQGMYIYKNVGLGFVRLSILDLSSAGHQPMFSANGRYCIIFNGEIFNYVELKKKLSSKYDFKTKTDTEVILTSYLEWGEKCVDKFNGMWAFAILDKELNSLFISRDRYGIKPLYYYADNQRIIFASEIKSIFSIIGSELNIDEKVMFDYLVYNRTDQSTSTFLDKVTRLQHGHNMIIKDSRLSLQKWYDLNSKLNNPWLDSNEYKTVLTSAIDIRLRSDVPVGICLSGGIDSSSITSLIIKELNITNLFTFSAVYGEGKKGDESNFINLYLNEIENLQYVHPTYETFLDEMDDFLDCHFEPVHTLSIYSQFKVIKEASKKVTVALDGQGADEQLAGYHYFFSSYFREIMRQLKLYKLFKEIINYYINYRSLIAYKFLVYYLIPSFLKNYIISKSVNGINAEFFNNFKKLSSLDKDLFNPKTLNESLLQHFEYKLEHNLKWNDLNSMYHSVELRVPFLDYRIVEKTLSSPTDFIINEGYTKWILRQAMQGILPEEIRLRRDKVGFDNPAGEWFRKNEFKNIIIDIIRSDIFRNSGFFDVQSIEKLYKNHLEQNIDINKDIWKWINIYFFLKRLKENK